MVEGLSAALGRLYAWVLRLAGHRHAEPALAVVAFTESSFFPVPPDAMIVPMVLARRTRWVRIALIALVGSVAGGFLGYAIGYLLWDAIGEAILGFYRLGDAFAEFRNWYADGGALIVFLAAFTPLPYKAVTIASGVVGMDLWAFGLASIAGRGLRFFVVAALPALLGAQAETLIRRHARLATWAGLALLAAVALAVVLAA